MLTSNTELTYSENEVCGSIRASNRMPITPSSDSNGEPCQRLPERAGAVLSATTAFFTGGTSGKVTAAITVHTAHSAEAMMLIQKNVA
ncbi:hypothetical protein D3C72_910310 [compost metagenome]